MSVLMNCSFTNESLGGNVTCPCVSDYVTARRMATYCDHAEMNTCRQFCASFNQILPYTYLGFSLLSAICCLLVFSTYLCIPRLSQTGYSSKVFLNRTLMDFVIAMGHIIAGIFTLAQSDTYVKKGACAALGTVNELSLMASNLWYVVLAVDLIRAIRNPFSSQPSYSWLSHLAVLLFSMLCAAILGLLALGRGPGGPGTSMFFWCWVGIEQSDDRYNFIIISLLLYYFLHILFWVFSMLVTVVAGCILWGHLAASSETRKFVLKQNLKYVSILGLETLFIVAFWLTQYSIAVHHNESRLYFFTHTDLALAVSFSFMHSCRGVVDLSVWAWTFSIGPTDITECCRRRKSKFSARKEEPFPSSSLNLSMPLISSKDNLVNRALRRNAIYCINVGILDAVQLDLDRSKRVNRIGSVRDPYTATALIEMDHENQRDEVGILYSNPTYTDESVRKIQFPASSSHLKEFSFIDLEPRVFSLLRESYGIAPRTYRKSFEIRNASDIDSSLMLEKFTEGKSGSFFYFTQDYRFIIKTVTASEERFLCKIAYQYYQHMKENEDSLIVRFFGLHKVRLAPEQRYITVVVMENIFYNTDHLKIHRTFDLKGSWVGRRSVKSSRLSESYKGTLKDLDLGEEKILIGVENKEQLMDQLRKDIQLLTKCRIMDYSLLLGIHQHGTTLTESASHAIEKDGAGEVNTIFQSPDKKSRATRHSTITSNYGYDQDFHIPWFRQDNGGLCSCPRDLEGDRSSVASQSNRDSMVNIGNPPVTYFFGVVDILQEYTVRKKMEHIWKTRVLRQNRHGLSAVNENEYGERFLKFLGRVLE